MTSIGDSRDQKNDICYYNNFTLFHQYFIIYKVPAKIYILSFSIFLLNTKNTLFMEAKLIGDEEGILL